MEESARRHPLLRRLRARKERHASRGPLYRVGFAVAGFAVLVAGLAMLVLPGPGLLVSAIGLAMLALEFAWAERILERVLHRIERAKQATRTQQAMGSGVFVLGVAGLVAAALVWDLPYLPF